MERKGEDPPPTMLMCCRSSNPQDECQTGTHLQFCLSHGDSGLTTTVKPWAPAGDYQLCFRKKTNNKMFGLCLKPADPRCSSIKMKKSTYGPLRLLIR